MLLDKNITKLPHIKLGTRIARTFQHVRLFRNLTLANHMEFAINDDDELFFKNIFTNTNVKEELLRDALDFVGLDKRRYFSAKFKLWVKKIIRFGNMFGKNTSY